MARKPGIGANMIGRKAPPPPPIKLGADLVKDFRLQLGKKRTGNQK